MYTKSFIWQFADTKVDAIFFLEVLFNRFFLMDIYK